MSVDFSQLRIGRVIIHEVVKQPLGEGKREPNFSEVDSEINQTTRIFLKDRVVETIAGTTAFDVLFDADTASPVPAAVRELLADDGDFVQLSKAIASHLNAVQPGSSPGGLVLVANGKIAGRPTAIVLKLEKIEAARLQQVDRNGKRTFDLSHLPDVVLSEKTKVFKIGLFLNKSGSVDFDGRVCDAQLPYVTNREVARFFLTKFLGCTLKEDPQIQTKNFFEASQDFVRQKVQSPTRQAAYTRDLVSYVSSNTQSIRPRTFARDHLKVEDRDPYLEHLEAKGVPTASQIIKELALIEGRLARMVLVFESGIQILAPFEEMNRELKVTDLENGKTRAAVEGQLKDIKPK